MSHTASLNERLNETCFPKWSDMAKHYNDLLGIIRFNAFMRTAYNFANDTAINCALTMHLVLEGSFWG